MDKYAPLKLDGQLCFPLYAVSREIKKLYRPFLEKLDLTYTQYIAMLVLWEEDSISVRDLGYKLHLDSGTLTPVLKSLEAKGLVKRYRCASDERVLIIEPTEKGAKMKEDALEVPMSLAKCIKLDMAEVKQLYDLLYKLLESSCECEG